MLKVFKGLKKDKCIPLNSHNRRYTPTKALKFIKQSYATYNDDNS